MWWQTLCISCHARKTNCEGGGVSKIPNNEIEAAVTMLKKK